MKKPLCIALTLLLLCGCAAAPATPASSAAPTLPAVTEPTLPTTTAPVTEPVTEPVPTTEAAPTTEAPTEPPTTAAPVPDPFGQHFDLSFAETPLPVGVGCLGNRAYVHVGTLEAALGESLPADAELARPAVEGTEGTYIPLLDAAKLFRLGVMFGEDGVVRVYRLAPYHWEVTSAEGEDLQPAYIRLEDIMADFGLNERFTHRRLNLLRLYCDYLGDHADAFYIAWIPLYVNPGEGIVNDISTDENYYNVDFVFTLDWLIYDGGRLGLHGLSHQSGSEVSAVGYEFTSTYNATAQETLERFQRAEAICAALGWEYSFFEFPHYQATELQKQTAEQYFDVICGYRDSKYQMNELVRQTGDHVCRWIPTPGDYIDGRYMFDQFLATLEYDWRNGGVVSFFLHPIVDFGPVYADIEGEVMTFRYEESEGMLAEILRKLNDWNCRFQAFD